MPHPPLRRLPRRLQPARRRLARPRGMIGVTALAIILLLSAISLALFVTAQSTVQTTRDSREYLQARHNLDTALADANTTLNTGSAAPHGEGAGPDDHPAAASRWSWRREYYADAPHDRTGRWTDGDWRLGGQVSGTGVRGDSTQTRDLPWQQRYVGSVLPQPDHADRPTYGIAAPSAWLATLATENDSMLESGTVTGDWHAYGPGQITIGSGHVERVIGYDPDADTDRTRTGTFARSAISAILDERLLNDRVRACIRAAETTGAQLDHYRVSDPGHATLGPRNGGHCVYDFRVDETLHVSGGVVEVVAYGNVTVSADINIAAGSELRLFTPAGSVAVRAAGNTDTSYELGSTHTTGGGFYLFAPNAVCRTYDDDTELVVRGSLACREAHLRGQFSPTAALPAAEPGVASSPGRADQTITYLETPGYTDRFHPEDH